MSQRIQVLIVEDSPVILLVLKRIFSASPEIDIVGTAGDGGAALELLKTLKPDVICTDFHMAPMNGLDFTREVMQQFPCPILVISASVQAEDTQNVFDLLEAGAIDVFPKPTTGLTSDYNEIAKELIGKVKILSGVKVFTRHRKKDKTTPPKETPFLPTHSPQSSPISSHKNDNINSTKVVNFNPVSPPDFINSLPENIPRFRSLKGMEIVAIGASTGGPQALHRIFTQLSHDFPIPIICIQHISNGFLEGLVDWLKHESRIPVKIAKVGELPQPGMIYFPAERRHLELDSLGRFVYGSTEPFGGHCPSITVTFKSVANFYGAHCAGVLLTGMGRDGAEGLSAIYQAGGLTIAQDEATSIVFGMPKEAIALGCVQYTLPISAIAPLLLAKIKS